jgi:hypothetical protein
LDKSKKNKHKTRKKTKIQDILKTLRQKCNSSQMEVTKMGNGVKLADG